jgi:hypothetical protein
MQPFFMYVLDPSFVAAGCGRAPSRWAASSYGPREGFLFLFSLFLRSTLFFFFFVFNFGSTIIIHMSGSILLEWLVPFFLLSVCIITIIITNIHTYAYVSMIPSLPPGILVIFDMIGSWFIGNYI